MSNQIKESGNTLSIHLVHIAIQWQNKHQHTDYISDRDKNQRKENRKGFQLLNLFAVFARDSIRVPFFCQFPVFCVCQGKKMERQSSRKINNRQWFSISMFRSKTTVTVDFFPHIFFVSAVYDIFFASFVVLFYYILCTCSVTASIQCIKYVCAQLLSFSLIKDFYESKSNNDIIITRK